MIEPQSSSVSAVVVLYGPQPADRLARLESIPTPKLCIVGNGAEACNWLSATPMRAGWSAVLFPTNPGLAVAFNAALEACTTEWLLLLDQDSELIDPGFEALVTTLNSAPSSVGIVTGVVIDEATNRSTNRRDGEIGTASALLEVPRFQNSGTVVRVAAARKIGGWWTALHLDLVDAEFGIRLHRSGWVQLHSQAAVLRHHLGEISEFRVGPLRGHATHHSVDRRRELGRAFGLTIRRHGFVHRDVRVTARHVLGNLTGMVVGERLRARKLCAFTSAFAHALLTRRLLPDNEITAPQRTVPPGD